MYRKEVVVRSMLPMALVAYAIYTEFQREELFGYFLIPIAAAYIGGRWATRRFDAHLHELLAALGLVGAIMGSLLAEPYWLLAMLMIGSLGLFLLPLFDRAMRSDPEVALPMPQARNVALGLVALFCLCGTIFEGGIRESLYYGAFLATWLCFPALMVALALVGAGKRREGAWAGSVSALVIVLFLIALSVFGYPGGY